MNKFILPALLCISFLSKGQFVTIPDPNFKTFLISQFPTCFNTSQQLDTTCTTLTNAYSLNASAFSITDIDGIQYFDNLMNLDISLNQISNLPYLPTTLTTLRCKNNLLVSLPDLPNILDLNFSNNLISTLPSIPNVVTLHCENNQLISLPVLGSLTTLYCSGNQLSNLPNFPIIQNLYCESNHLSSLPSFPNLQYLNCNFNQITNLPTLSNSLIELSCDHNLLKTLPTLPNSLLEIRCNENHLMVLPKLPINLNVLYCYSNHLFHLPTLPLTLKQLYCGGNLITKLPALPNSMQTLFCENNQHLACLPELPLSLSAVFYSGCEITCLPNATNTLTFPICSGICQTKPTCSGYIYNDINLNGNFEVGIDQLIPKWIITTSTSWTASTDKYGEYQISLTQGVANTIKPNKLVPYSTISPSNYILTPTNDDFQGDSYNFALALIPNVNDLSIQLTPSFARGGFKQLVTANIQNVGTTKINNAILKVRIPNSFVFNSASPAITSQVGDTLIWDNIQVDLFEEKSFNIIWSILPVFSPGSPYHIESWVFPIIADSNTNNNYNLFSGEVMGSYDPNIKEVNKTSLMPTQLGEDLVYTVHFQNTGTDTAFNIFIQDQLSENLDISTFRMLNASHAFDFTIRENGLLEVFFQDVQLVDSFTNEPQSHGLFKYSIKPKNNLKGGDFIPNSAAIYFDYNPAIITNTVYTTIAAPSDVSNINEINAEIFPNPTTGKAIIRMSASSGHLSILDLNGKIIFNRNITNNEEIDLSAFPNAIYIGKLETNGGNKYFKISKQHN